MGCTCRTGDAGGQLRPIASLRPVRAPCKEWRRWRRFPGVTRAAASCWTRFPSTCPLRAGDGGAPCTGASPSRPRTASPPPAPVPAVAPAPWLHRWPRQARSTRAPQLPSRLAAGRDPPSPAPRRRHRRRGRAAQTSWTSSHLVPSSLRARSSAPARPTSAAFRAFGRSRAARCRRRRSRPSRIQRTRTR